MEGTSSCEESYSEQNSSFEGENLPEILIEPNTTQIFTELLELKKYEDGYQVIFVIKLTFDQRCREIE